MVLHIFMFKNALNFLIETLRSCKASAIFFFFFFVSLIEPARSANQVLPWPTGLSNKTVAFYAVSRGCFFFFLAFGPPCLIKQRWPLTPPGGFSSLTPSTRLSAPPVALDMIIFLYFIFNKRVSKQTVISCLSFDIEWSQFHEQKMSRTVRLVKQDRVS